MPGALVPLTAQPVDLDRVKALVLNSVTRRIIKLALSPTVQYGYTFAAVGAAFQFPLSG